MRSLWRRAWPWGLALALLAGACGQGNVPPEPRQAASGTSASGPPSEIANPDKGPLVVFLGDSLTAGYGLAEEQAFPALCGERLRAQGIPVRVVNAGVSGDTTTGGLERVDWLLAQQPDLLVVELGGNDGLRALPVEQTERNLRAIVARARGLDVPVLLLAMQIPPSYGNDYARRFRELYPRLARELDVPLVEDFLDGVGGVRELNLADGIHPTAEGHRRLADNILPELTAALRAHDRR